MNIVDRQPLGNGKNNIIKANIPSSITTTAQLIEHMNDGMYADVKMNNATDSNKGATTLGTPINAALFNDNFPQVTVEDDKYTFDRDVIATNLSSDGDVTVDGNIKVDGIIQNTGNALPLGAGDFDYWKNVPQGTYFYNTTLSGAVPLSVMPSSYGIIVVNRYTTEGTALFHVMSRGAIYRLSWNDVNLYSWTEINMYRYTGNTFNCNDLKTCGCYGVLDAQNAPSTGMYAIEVFKQSEDRVGQRATMFSDTSSNGSQWNRYYNGVQKTWSAWKSSSTFDTLTASGNIAAGSISTSGNITINGIIQNTGNELPPGSGDVAYWKEVQQGTYYYNHTLSGAVPLSSMPAGYGLVVVNKRFSEGCAMFYTHATGAIYKQSWTGTTRYPWYKVESYKILWTGKLLGGNTLSLNTWGFSKIRIYAISYNVDNIFEIDMTKKISTASDMYRGCGVTATRDSDGRISYYYAEVSIPPTNDSFQFPYTGYEKSNAHNNRNNNSDYYIYRVEGIY